MYERSIGFDPAYKAFIWEETLKVTVRFLESCQEDAICAGIFCTSLREGCVQISPNSDASEAVADTSARWAAG
jgi:hypothetical protein